MRHGDQSCDHIQAPVNVPKSKRNICGKRTANMRDARAEAHAHLYMQVRMQEVNVWVRGCNDVPASMHVWQKNGAVAISSGALGPLGPLCAAGHSDRSDRFGYPGVALYSAQFTVPRWRNSGRHVSVKIIYFLPCYFLFMPTAFKCARIKQTPYKNIKC
jgi:hypothetical protein